jgi:thioredoxin-related protein
MRGLFFLLFLYFFSLTFLFSRESSIILFERVENDSLKNWLPKNLKLGTKGSVFIWMNSECPICNKYPLVWKKLTNDFPSVPFIGVFTAYDEPRMARKFIKKYNLPFQWFVDEKNNLAAFLKVTTTPEVILIDANAKIIYRGATDDWFYALGKNKTVTQHFYLQNALTAFLNNQPVVTFQTNPIGCIFSY